MVTFNAVRPIDPILLAGGAGPVLQIPRSLDERHDPTGDERVTAEHDGYRGTACRPGQLAQVGVLHLLPAAEIGQKSVRARRVDLGVGEQHPGVEEDGVAQGAERLEQAVDARFLYEKAENAADQPRLLASVCL